MVSFCTRTLHNAPCDVPDCPFDHNWKVCMPCAAICVSPTDYKSHLESIDHQLATQSRIDQDDSLEPQPEEDEPDEPQPVLLCSLCPEIVTPDAAWNVHVASPEHETKACDRRRQDKIYWPRLCEQINSFRCTFCRETSEDIDQHVEGSAHVLRQRVGLGFAEIGRGERAYGAQVSHLESGIEFRQVREDATAKGFWVDLRIKSIHTSTLRTEKSHEKTLHIVRMEVPARFTATVREDIRDLAPGQGAALRIGFTPDKMGIYEGRVDVTLQRGSQDPMTVTRKLVAVVMDPLWTRQMYSLAPGLQSNETLAQEPASPAMSEATLVA